jgi:hypothetical protein
MVTKKKSTKKKTVAKKVVETKVEKKSNICLGVIVALLLILVGLSVACLTLLLMNQHDAKANDRKVVPVYKYRDPDFEYEGWIDCMPPLDEYEADLCKRAEEAGYPYIAY